MTVGRALLKGLGIGIIAYLAVVGCLTLFGVGSDDLQPLRDYASCLVTPDTAGSDCGRLAASPTDAEASSQASFPDRLLHGVRDWGSALIDAALRFTEEWILPISNRLVAVADFVGEHIMKR